MGRQSRLLAGLLSQIVILTAGTHSALSQSAWETNRFISCQENPATHSLVMTTAKRIALPAPTVSYLPGDDGETIMVADFVGVSWKMAPRVFRSTPGQPPPNGITEIRIGRLQESPPICRVSITATNPKAFKAISFQAQPGSLGIRWGKSTAAAPAIARTERRSPEPVRGYTPAPKPVDENNATQSWSSSNLNESRLSKANDTSGSEDGSPKLKAAPLPSLSPVMPPLAPTIRGSKKAIADDAPDIAVANNTLASTQQQPTVKPSAPVKDEYASATPPITISVESGPLHRNGPEALKLQIKASHPITYTAFRLHSPERYVIDFANCPELTNAQIPDVSQNTFVRSVRVGQLYDEDKTRLVLDLTDTPVSVKEETSPNCKKLALTLLAGEGIDVKSDAAETPIPMPQNFSHLSMPAGTVIVLDAGHGGTDPGAQRGDIQEKEITMGIINKLKRDLEASGARVVMTRSDDTFVSLEDRVRITNATNPTLFLSVHINAMESASDIHGVETYYQTDQSRLFADSVHECLVSGLSAPDRNVRKARFYVIRNTAVPAVLAEVGFISNKDERDKLISSDYQFKIADALEHGVILFLDRRLALRKSGVYTKSNDNLPNSYQTTSTVGTNQTGGRSISRSGRQIAQNKHKSSDSDDDDTQ